MFVDPSPLIYLAKIDALDVFEASGHTPLITPQVERETARSGLAYEHPDSLVIAQALRSGLLRRTDPSAKEIESARRLMGDAGGIGTGEAEVLAAAAERSLPVLVSERRASRLAQALGIESRTPIDLLFAGTREREQLRERIRRYADLVQLRIADLDHLTKLIEARTP